MTVSVGGTSAAPDYYGVDQTWYTGSSWARPIFNFGDTSDPNGNTIGLSAAYVTIDNIEMTNLYWNTAPNGANVAYIYVSAPNVTISKSYFHGWSHSYAAGDNLKVIIGAPYAINGTVAASKLGIRRPLALTLLRKNRGTTFELIKPEDDDSQGSLSSC
jgi:hypothetical protein